MAFDLKALVCSVNVENENFKGQKDRELSRELYARHSLQSVLENASGFVGKTAPKSTKDLTSKFLSALTVLIEQSPDEWVSTFIYGFNHPDTFSLCVKCLRTVTNLAGINY